VLTRRAAAMAAALVVALAGCHSNGSAEPAATEPAATEATPSSPVEPVPPAQAANDDVNAWRQVGTSVQGRPLRALTLGHGPRKVLFIGGIHGDEDEGTYTTAQLPAAFLADGLADTVTLTILEDANPDGRAAGSRGNADGVDVNRNFPAKNFDTGTAAYGGSPLSQPESRAVKALIDEVNPALVLVSHSWSGDEFINFDGPAREIAERFSAATGLKVKNSSSFAPTPGSLGSWAGRDRGIALLTIEILKGTDPQREWERIKTALLAAIAG